ncbi:uncharacterized protein F5147DRAFT_659501 [Suillus discolor]|uniref:Uncharacterized protein n=1 Tax=Suillus discolor TaxID=1912936 RepID=A0A9P7ESG7_9AGAM|nr:uncharacterized protein F5147DRAFT_659501 [Suillus discolor]KAG2085471.1 hypothetical protein F5147DRAFT_659501 [Suillus discolor]
MLSLGSAEAHPNIQMTLSIIHRGGKKAQAWLKDKESSKFALPAIYWPMSLIPIAIWKASPTTTNGNEQAHRNINRDGINLTLLAGIMHGYQYDVCAASSIDLHIMHGINTRDYESTHLYRAKRSVSRQIQTQKQRIKSHSQPTSRTNHQINDLQLPFIPDPLTCNINQDRFAQRSNTDNKDMSLSTYSTLAYALTPGAGIVDYCILRHPTLRKEPESQTWAWACISTYSSLSRALGNS